MTPNETNQAAEKPSETYRQIFNRLWADRSVRIWNSEEADLVFSLYSECIGAFMEASIPTSEAEAAAREAHIKSHLVDLINASFDCGEHDNAGSKEYGALMEKKSIAERSIIAEFVSLSASIAPLRAELATLQATVKENEQLAEIGQALSEIVEAHTLEKDESFEVDDVLKSHYAELSQATERIKELETERDKKKECITTLCSSWAEDHTHLQELCRRAGCTEMQVSGDSYGVPDITELADLLNAALTAARTELEGKRKINQRLTEELKDMAQEVSDIGTTAHCISLSGPATTPTLQDAWSKFDGISVRCSKVTLSARSALSGKGEA